MNPENGDGRVSPPHAGRVTLVGAGPGDPGLITVKGLQCLAEADVVIYDYLIPSELLEHVKDGAELVFAGKRAADHHLKQDQINALMVRHAREGKTVCRLKGGDPFLFGRGGEEALHLVEEGIDYQVVPGVSSSLAVPAYAGIPVTHRGLSRVLFISTGHEDAAAPEGIPWEKLAGEKRTLVFFMGFHNLSHIVEKLLAHGMAPGTPAALIHRGTTPRQKTVCAPLNGLVDAAREAGLATPTLVIVGEVVGLRERLSWYEKLALFGRSIVVTGPPASGEELISALRALGARVRAFPTIRITPPKAPAPLEKAVLRLSGYDWIVLTSVHGVEALMNALEAAGRDARAFAGCRLCAVGPATAGRLRSFGLKPDLVPEKFVSHSLFDALKEAGDPQGRRFLLPRGDLAPSTLPDALRGAGALVDEVVAYANVPETYRPEEIEEVFGGDPVDAVAFTASSTVSNFVSILGADRVGELARRCAFVSIGPLTSGTLRDLGLSVAVEAAPHSAHGLVLGICAHFRDASPCGE